MIKKLIIIFFLLPLLSNSQDKKSLDSLNKKYDSVLMVIKRPQMRDSMVVLDKLLAMLREIDIKRYSLKYKK